MRSENIFTGGLETLLLDALAACASIQMDEAGDSYLTFDRVRAKDLVDEYLNQRVVGRGA